MVMHSIRMTLGFSLPPQACPSELRPSTITDVIVPAAHLRPHYDAEISESNCSTACPTPRAQSPVIPKHISSPLRSAPFDPPPNATCSRLMASSCEKLPRRRHRSRLLASSKLTRMTAGLKPGIKLVNSGSVARDHLASERTFLAYVRTSLAISAMGIGQY
jgi:hypothetical protein